MEALLARAGLEGLGVEHVRELLVERLPPRRTALRWRLEQDLASDDLERQVEALGRLLGPEGLPGSAQLSLDVIGAVLLEFYGEIENLVGWDEKRATRFKRAVQASAHVDLVARSASGEELPVRRCATCGGLFTGRPSKRYCSRPCLETAKKRRSKRPAAISRK